MTCRNINYLRVEMPTHYQRMNRLWISTHADGTPLTRESDCQKEFTAWIKEKKYEYYADYLKSIGIDNFNHGYYIYPVITKIPSGRIPDQIALDLLELFI